MPEETDRPRRPPLLVGTAALVAAGVSAWIYVSIAGPGNVADPGCAPSVAAAAALKPLAVGHMAPFQASEAPRRLADLAFVGPDGAAASLGDFAGRTVLVNLWATWCKPCRQEMPALDRLAQEEGGDDFAVIPVNIDLGNEGLPARFLAEIGAAALPLYLDPDWAAFNAIKGIGLIRGGLPTTILLDGAGCTLGLLEGPAEWDSDDAKALLAAARRPAV